MIEFCAYPAFLGKYFGNCMTNFSISGPDNDNNDDNDNHDAADDDDNTELVRFQIWMIGYGKVILLS